MASKLNLVVRLQHWMDSVPGQTFLNYAYSWGASIVILGALFKLTHLPGGNLMLFLGMGTEAFVFFLAAFDRPFDKNSIDKELADDFETDEEIERAEQMAAARTAGTYAGPAVVGGPVVAGGAPVVVGGAPVVGGGVPVAGAEAAEAGAETAEAAEGEAVAAAAGAPVVIGGGVAAVGVAVPGETVVYGHAAGATHVPQGVPSDETVILGAGTIEAAEEKAVAAVEATAESADTAAAPVATPAEGAEVPAAAVETPAEGAEAAAAAEQTAPAAEGQTYEAPLQAAVSAMYGTAEGTAFVEREAAKLAEIIRMANDELLRRAQAVLSPEMEEATEDYIEKLRTLNETLVKVDEQSARLTRDSQEMENLNRTLIGINKVYDLHFASISRQVTTIEDINRQTTQLAAKIEEVNAIYTRMMMQLGVMVNPMGAAATGAAATAAAAPAYGQPAYGQPAYAQPAYAQPAQPAPQAVPAQPVQPVAQPMQPVAPAAPAQPVQPVQPAE